MRVPVACIGVAALVSSRGGGQRPRPPPPIRRIRPFRVGGSIRDNGLMNDLAVSEHDAAVAWALAYNTHDPSVLAPILADDVRVMSRWVVNDLVGRNSYLEYLRRKFATFERAGTLVRVEVARAPGGGPETSGRPCALIEQDGTLLATVLFDVLCGRIAQISLGPHPSPESCWRSGEFPGFDSEPDLVN
jgi:hypothetical protein